MARVVPGRASERRRGREWLQNSRVQQEAASPAAPGPGGRRESRALRGPVACPAARHWREGRPRVRVRVCDVRVCPCSVSSVFLETLISIYFEESKALKNYTPYAFNYIAYKTGPLYGFSNRCVERESTDM